MRTTDSLWVACGIKQLLMRVFGAQTHPLPGTLLKKELRQRQQVLLPCPAQPCVSLQPRMAVAGSQAWMGPLSIAFPHNEYTKALDEPLPFPNRKWDFWICIWMPLLTFLSPGVQSPGSAPKGKVKCRRPRQGKPVSPPNIRVPPSS